MKDKLEIVHYYFPNTDPWKNIMLLTEEEAFKVADRLAKTHPNETSFGRFSDFVNYYPARKNADDYVLEEFIRLGGNPKLNHPYSFTLGECGYLKEWFKSEDKLVYRLSDIPDDQISFTMGDSCALLLRGIKPTVLTKKMLLERIHACGDSLEVFLKELPDNCAYVEVQLWDKI